MANYGVVLLLGVVSLMAESITVVLMSLGYGGYQTGTLSPNYTTTFATTSYYTDAPEYYTTKAPDYYTKLRLSRPTPPKSEVLFFPELHHQGTGAILDCV
ncbi:hypothetical protein DAPPUDRAFT_241289 [Daphnia pulex]|uniref:Uncharacterized protein n=1 Tax=Daphnia pulex TaxID=6669 RepID=E9GDW5_DAPPU|nr:hypothetical protein DAPPUDRAFT_241289 [Daphnia pulex]|eukprot:EFX82157.1 hypothetical protein DAPPUDRAFT_241289 [Daphnia pulex]